MDGKDTIGSQGGQTSANDELTITLVEGTSGTNNNFAELLGRLLAGSLAGNGEDHYVMFASTGLELYAADESGQPTGSALKRTTTNYAGEFEFAGLTPQSYVVKPEAQPFLLSGSTSSPFSLTSADSVDNTLSKRG